MRGRIILSIIVLWALGAVLCILFHRRTPEPRYNGLPLSDCVRYLVSSPTPARETEVDAALDQFDTNSIPYLLEWLHYETPWWKPKLAIGIGELPPRTLTRPLGSWIASSRSEELAQGSLVALATLAQQGKAFPAAEGLLEMLNDPRAPETGNRALWALLAMNQARPLAAGLGKPDQAEFCAAIRKFLRNAPIPVQAALSNAIVRVYPELLTNTPAPVPNNFPFPISVH